MEGIYGTKGELRLQIQSLEGSKALRFPALVSKNSKPNEKPFRLSWFKMRGNVPSWSGHVSVSQTEAKALATGSMPERVWLYLVRGFNAQDATFTPGVQEGRDDLKKLPLPPVAKAYARRKGLASMKRQPQDFINVMAAITNQKHLQKGFKNTDSSGKVPHAFKESVALALALLLETDEDDPGFKDVYPTEQSTFKVYSKYGMPLPGEGLNIEWNFQVPSPVEGGKYVNKLFIPFGNSYRAQQHAVIERMKKLAQQRHWPAGAEFATPWGRYLIQNGTIIKV